MVLKIVLENSAIGHFRAFLQSAALLILFLTGIGGIAVYAQTPSKSTQQVASKNYKIGIGDILKVVVAKQDLLSLDSVRVSNEGTIRLPMLDGEIPAACLTETEIAAVITEKYKKYLVNPQVYVAVQEFRSNPVAVLGAVNAPGRFDIQRPTRLLELLTFVNGPAANAGESIQIFRTPGAAECRTNINSNPETEKPQEIIVLSMAELMKGGESVNLFVQSGDIITLPPAEDPAEAYIIGNVNSAKTIVLKEPTTLSKAIAMAGGVTKEAKSDKIKITRQDSKSLAKTIIIANIKEIEKDNQKDILLQANDIVEVPGPTGTEKLLRDIFQTIVPSIGRGIIPIP